MDEPCRQIQDFVYRVVEKAGGDDAIELVHVW